MEELTEKQLELYQAIKEYINKYGFGPTFRDLMTVLDKSSTATISFGLRILKRKGYIDYVPKRMRTIKILKEV